MNHDRNQLDVNLMTSLTNQNLSSSLNLVFSVALEQLWLDCNVPCDFERSQRLADSGIVVYCMDNWRSPFENSNVHLDALSDRLLNRSPNTSVLVLVDYATSYDRWSNLVPDSRSSLSSSHWRLDLRNDWECICFEVVEWGISKRTWNVAELRRNNSRNVWEDKTETDDLRWTDMHTSLSPRIRLVSLDRWSFSHRSLSI